MYIHREGYSHIFNCYHFMDRDQLAELPFPLFYTGIVLADTDCLFFCCGFGYFGSSVYLFASLPKVATW